MTPAKSRFLAFVGALAATTAVANPQQTPASAPVASELPSQLPSPSLENIKRAKQAGYRTKLRKGFTVFCKTEAPIGSHFESETCIGENQLELVLDREELQRAQLHNRGCIGGGACGGSK